MSDIDGRQFALDLRNNATPEEWALWRALSGVRPRFTRQLRIKPFVGDFACRRARLLVEVDGGQHAESASDLLRTLRLEQQGWRVIRFWNPDIRTNLDGVVEAIVSEIERRLPEGERVEFTSSRAGRSRRPRSREQKHHP